MLRRSRTSGQEMNFDGLADSVTNLVGALILVVILVIGVTGDAVSQPPPEKSPSSRNGGDRSLKSLQNKLAALRVHLHDVEQETGKLNERLNSLRDEADELFDKVDRLQPPPSETEEPTADSKVRDVLYRPPFEKASEKSSHQFWVQGNRIVAMKKFKDMCDEIDQAYGKKKGKVKVQLTIWNDNFILEGDMVVSGDSFGADDLKKSSLALRLSPNAKGETLQQLTEPDSQFRRLLKNSDPKEFALTFEVLPDSFEAYRVARQIAWEHGFDIGWEPLEAGEPMRFGLGGTRTQ